MNQRIGVMESTVLRLVGRRGLVRKTERVGERFRLITIGGDDLVERLWHPGYMLQFSFGSWESRAYTPHSYDAASGCFEFVGFVHGNGMGSAWLESVSVGEPCVLVGPRAAINLETIARPLLFFGDETSFSTAAALGATSLGYRVVEFVFEVANPEECAPILQKLGLAHGTVFRREPDERHLDAVERHVLGAFESPRRGIFTGKAGSISRLYKAARRAGVPGKQITNIAYWSPGRQGFSGVQR